MKTSEVKNTLHVNNVSFDTLSQRDGVFTLRRGFFYRHGNDANKIAAKVQAALPDAMIVDRGEVWKPFRGGASVAQGSHWYVKFTV